MIQLRVGGKYRTRAGYSVEITASDGALFHGLARPGGETTPMSWHPDGLAVAPRESVWASGRFDIAEEVRTPVPRIGGKYRTRAGYVAEILSFNPDPLAVWPWRGTVEIVPGEPQGCSWMLSGRAFGAYTDDPADLMEEIPT